MCDPHSPEMTPEAVESCKAAVEEASCLCTTFCDKLKQKLREIDAKEVFESTMTEVRKRPLLGVLIAGTIGYFLGRLSKKFA